jgi:predicted nucleic acid-binding protein
MACYFLDSSALAKHYHSEIGTPRVDAILAEPSANHFISRLCVTEVHSVFAKKVREGALPASALAGLLQRFRADIALKKYSVVSVSALQFDEAERLLEVYASAQNLRTLDALQLAAAAAVHAAQPLDHFVTSDRRIQVVAAAEGRSIIDPERP